MALNLRRWVVAVVAGSALILLAYRPRDEETRPVWWEQRLAVPTPEQRRLDALGTALRQARSELVLAERRDTLLRMPRPRTRIDSLLAVPRRLAPNSGSPQLQVMFPLSAERRRAVDQALAQVWRGVGPGDTTIRVAAVILDRYGLDTYLLPYGTDGRTCIAALPIGWDMRRLSRPGEEPPPNELMVAFFEDGLGPCAYYAAFGRPGPQIEHWLEQRRFDLAGRFDWHAHAEVQPETSPNQLLETFLSPYFDSRFSASFDALGCAAGDAAACRKALFQPSLGPSLLPRALPGVVIGIGWLGEGRGFYGGESYLTDLVREMGRGRFGLFWRSTLGPDSAFAAAFDQPIDRWTARWQQRRLRGMVLRNRVSPTAVLLSVLLAAAVIGGGALVATRRTVG